MNRRTFVRTAGAVGAAGLAGCSLVADGDDGSDGGNDTGNQGDNETGNGPGHQDEYPDGVEEGEIVGTDENGFRLLHTRGENVPLVPTDVAYEWYQNEAVVVGDARAKQYYEWKHIVGAVWSPAVDGQESNDPLEALPTDQRILTYCRCPHHLSSARASALIRDGYEQVYALDKGLDDWEAKGYPIAGEGV
jgi:rhodanese-related sulfurtransferase